jgi:serine/threonine protein kinase
MASSPIFCHTCGAANQPQASLCHICGHPLQASEATGPTTATGRLPNNQFLKQRYRILASVGKGGMGAVYRAEDTQLGNRKVAVKEMSQSNLSPQEIVEAAEAFKREAHMLAGLQHPNLPNIYDHFFEGERWYLVMSFIQGETLEDYLDKANGGKLPVGEALQIGIQLCTVLNYLHTQQPPIIFRDLKPSNVMLTQDGHLYLIDFGIARHFKAGQTKDTAAYGSAGYSSPEQYGKAQTTLQSDIYSLGALLHQMLSGTDPSDSPFHFAPLQTRGQPALTELDTLLMSMLEMDAHKRPASMAAVKQSLEWLANQQQQQALETPQWQNQRQAEISPESRQDLQPQSSARFPQYQEYAAQQGEQSSPMSAQIYQYQPIPQYFIPPRTDAMRQSINGLTIAGFVCGIIGIFTGWILIGLPFSIVGLVLSLVGMRHRKGKGMAIAGLVLSIIGIVTTVIIYAFVIIFNNG